MIPFLPLSLHRSDALALQEDASGTAWSWRELVDQAKPWTSANAGAKQLVFLYCRNRLQDVAALLGLLDAGHVVALLDPGLPDGARKRLVEKYAPDIIVEEATAEAMLPVSAEIFPAIHSENALLLSTSGSTGSPKFVRLSLRQLECNAEGIAQVLDIRAGEVGSAHLPLHYSYGLSVLTSHLRAGAPLLLSERGFMDGGFWKSLAAAKVRHLPGVPYHYQMMQRLGLARLPLADIRVLTQAGGGLPVEAKRQFWEFMDAKGGHFHVLYGQTEAAPRMTTLSHEDFPLAPASVGTPLPGGRIEAVDAQGAPVSTGEVGEIVYHGSNVMLGYAESRSDLASGDIVSGTLATGDRGFVDEAGRVTLVGRANRIVKVVGLRINLDDIETGLAQAGTDVAVTAHGDRLRIHYSGDIDQAKVREQVSSFSSLPAAVLQLVPHERLPRTVRGKIDRSSLE